MSKMRTALTAMVAVAALAFVAGAVRRRWRYNAGEHKPVERRNGDELGRQLELAVEHAQSDELGHVGDHCRCDGRSRRGRLELQLDVGRQRRGSDQHGVLVRNGRSVVADCQLDVKRHGGSDAIRARNRRRQHCDRQ